MVLLVEYGSLLPLIFWGRESPLSAGLLDWTVIQESFLRQYGSASGIKVPAASDFWGSRKLVYCCTVIQDSFLRQHGSAGGIKVPAASDFLGRKPSFF